MTENDLTPKSVDVLPEKYPPMSVVALPCRSGHFYDPRSTIAMFGIRACDTGGKEWLVCENEEGVYKKKKGGKT